MVILYPTLPARPLTSVSCNCKCYILVQWNPSIMKHTNIRHSYMVLHTVYAEPVHNLLFSLILFLHLRTTSGCGELGSCTLQKCFLFFFLLKKSASFLLLKKPPMDTDCGMCTYTMLLLQVQKCIASNIERDCMRLLR